MVKNSRGGGYSKASDWEKIPCPQGVGGVAAAGGAGGAAAAAGGAAAGKKKKRGRRGRRGRGRRGGRGRRAAAEEVEPVAGPNAAAVASAQLPKCAKGDKACRKQLKALKKAAKKQQQAAAQAGASGEGATAQQQQEEGHVVDSGESNNGLPEERPTPGTCVEPSRQVELRGLPDAAGTLLGHAAPGEQWEQASILANGWVRVKSSRGEGFTKPDGWGLCAQVQPVGTDTEGVRLNEQERANAEASGVPPPAGWPGGAQPGDPMQPQQQAGNAAQAPRVVPKKRCRDFEGARCRKAGMCQALNGKGLPNICSSDTHVCCLPPSMNQQGLNIGG